MLLIVQKASEKATVGSSYQGTISISVGTIFFHRYQPRGFVDIYTKLRPQRSATEENVTYTLEQNV